MLKIKANDNINKLKTNLHELYVMCSLPHIFEFHREREKKKIDWDKREMKTIKKTQTNV